MDQMIMGNLVSYLISIGAGATWDAVKLIIGGKPENSFEEKGLLSVAATMKSFYDHMEFEYDENIVMGGFLEEAQKYRAWKWHLRDIVEYAIGQNISDESFAWWVNELKKNIPWIDDIFIDRDRVRKRLEYKIDDEEFQSFGDIFSFANRTATIFKTSWKQEIISLLDNLDLDLSFAYRPEKCSVLLKFFKSLDIDWDRLEKKK